MKYPILIFDAMDTLIRDPFFHLYPRYFNMEIDRLCKVQTPNIWPQFELGSVTEEEYFHQFFLAHTGHHIDNPVEFKLAIFESYCFIDGMEDLLEELYSLGFSLWIHSNYSIWFEEIRKRLELDRPKIYKKMVTRKKEKECLMII